MVHNGKSHQEEKAGEEIGQPQKNEAAMYVSDTKGRLPGNEDQRKKLVSNSSKSGQQVNFTIEANGNGWLLHNEKDKSIKIQKLFFGDEEQFFRSQDLCDYLKETGHKIGPLIPEYVDAAPYLQNVKRLSLLAVDYVSDKDDEDSYYVPQLFTLVQDVSLAAILCLLAAAEKYADIDEVLEELQKCFFLHSGMKERSQIEDLPEQSRNRKMVSPLKSGHVQTGSDSYKHKNLTEDNRYIDQDLLHAKNSSVYSSRLTESLTKKNFPYLSDDFPEDCLVRDEMCSAHCHHQGGIVSRRLEQSQKSVEMCSAVFGHKPGKCSMDSFDAGIKISLHPTQSWIDSSRGMPGIPGGRRKLTLKEDQEEFEINGIDKNLPKDWDKKRKNSAGRHGGYEDDQAHGGWRNEEVDPVLKLDVAHLRCRPEAVSITREFQQEQAAADVQDILSSLTEESELEKERSGEVKAEEGMLTVKQDPSEEDTMGREDSVSEKVQAEGNEKRNGEEILEHVPNSKPAPAGGSRDSGSGGEASHPCEARGEADFHPVPPPRTLSDSMAEEQEMPRNARRSGHATSFFLGYDVNRETESTPNDRPGYMEHSGYDMEEGACGAACAAGHDADSSPSDRCFPQPVSQSSTQTNPDREGLPGSFRAPVQVSSAGNLCAPYTDLCNGFEGEHGILSLQPESGGSALWENSVVRTAQESQSHRGLGADRRRTPTDGQEQSRRVRISQPAKRGLESGNAEQLRFSFTSQHPQEHLSVQSESHSYTHAGNSAIQEASFSHDSLGISQPVSPTHTLPVQSATESLSHSSAASASSPSLPIRLPPITVISASSMPPWATKTPLIDLSQAVDQEFVQLRQRRGTYGNDWPFHNSGIDAANMALSGFFFTGRGHHQVRCFYCGLELDHLTSAHNVWDEHVRHNPDCVYLNAVMGREFVLETLRQLRQEPQ